MTRTISEETCRDRRRNSNLPRVNDLVVRLPPRENEN